MSIIFCQVLASDVIDVEVLSHGRAGVPFLNWKLSTKSRSERGVDDAEAFAGAGLYALCFDNSLIYIGSFLGNGKKIVKFSGDVVASRWWTHIGAITTRGSRVHIAPRSLTSITKDLGAEHVMVNGFINASQPELLHVDEGDLSPLRRLMFAAHYCSDFLAIDADPSKILERFSFSYVRYPKLPLNISAERLTTHIKDAEKRLIKRLAPSCNATNVPRGMESVDVSLNEVLQLLQEELDTL